MDNYIDEESLVEATKIAGSLVRTEGKIATARFNRAYTALGFPHVSPSELRQFMVRVQQDEELLSIYEDALEGRAVSLNEAEEPVATVDTLPAVTPDIIDREFNKAAVRNYKKYQRQGAIQEGLSNMVAERVSKELVDVIKAPKVTAKTRPYRSDDPLGSTLIIGLSDWHIGATVKGVNGNSYDVSVARNRLELLASEAEATIQEQNISEVVIIHGGDYVEHVSMRNVNQAFDAEMDMAEQIATANRLLIDFIQEIASLPEVKHVKIGLVGGNHDRYQGDKKASIYNDNIAYNMVDNLLLLNDYSALGDNVEIIDNRHDIYSFEFSVYNKVFRVVHGDHLKNNDSPKIPTMIKDHMIDYMFFGHYHSTKIIQENGAATSIMIGSLQGNNTYSKELNLPDSQAAQLLMVVSAITPDSPVYQPVYL